MRKPKGGCKHPLSRRGMVGEFNQVPGCLKCGASLLGFKPRRNSRDRGEPNGIMALRGLLLQAADEIDRLRGANLRMRKGLRRVSLESMSICADACMLEDHAGSRVVRKEYAADIHRSLGKIQRIIWEARGGVGPRPLTGTKWSKG